MRKQAFAVLAPLLLVMAGCMTAALPQDLIDRAPYPEPLRMKEIVRLSKLGISPEVIVDLVRTHGIADRSGPESIFTLRNAGVPEPVLLAVLASPPKPPAPKPQPRVVHRDLFLPLWPSYSGGRWHLGLRIACTYRVSGLEVQETRPEPELEEAPPVLVEP